MGPLRVALESARSDHGGRNLSTFLSTYSNKVDRKGRVSVPAAYRAALSGATFQGVIAYPSLTGPVIEAFGREMLERMNQERLTRSMEGGAFEEVLLGGGNDTAVETVMAMARELPFDGEGRIILPAALSEHAHIGERAVFVGRGSRFQIWAPDPYELRQAEEVEKLRRRLSDGGAS
jgi:transcriptional regulator MraZ